MFSTSTIFEAEKPYKPYAVYAMLEHGGDFKAAMTALVRAGYGAKANHKSLPESSVIEVPNDQQEKPEFEIKRFIDLEAEDADSYNNILGNRFLCRGSCAMFFGYSGVGKSSFITQIIHMWALGKETLGLRPARPLNILLIQAENDEGDLVEMRDGSTHGMIEEGLLTAKQAKCAQKFVWTVRISSKCGAQVGGVLAQMGPGFDLVILDPLFAYLGGDSADQKDVSFFLRNVIDPVISRLNLALLIVHHTNKPPKDGNHGATVADMAYLSAGSAELTNYPRGILALLPTPRSDVFRLVAAKRGDRLGWGKDLSGKPRRQKILAQSDGYICWREMSDSEASEVMDESGSGKDGIQKRAREKADRIKRAKDWLMANCRTGAMLLQEIHNRLELDFGLSREQDRRNVIRFVEETGSDIDRVKARKGKVDAWILGRTKEAHEQKVKIEKEYAENQQSKFNDFAPATFAPDKSK